MTGSPPYPGGFGENLGVVPNSVRPLGRVVREAGVEQKGILSECDRYLFPWSCLPKIPFLL